MIIQTTRTSTGRHRRCRVRRPRRGKDGRAVARRISWVRHGDRRWVGRRMLHRVGSPRCIVRCHFTTTRTTARETGGARRMAVWPIRTLSWEDIFSTTRAG